jgi:hypothetical protein
MFVVITSSGMTRDIDHWDRAAFERFLLEDLAIALLFLATSFMNSNNNGLALQIS